MRRRLALVRGPRGLSLATQAVGAAFGFAGFALVARGLAPEAFGGWVLYLTVATFGDVLRSGLAQAALVQQASGRSAAEADRVLGAAWAVGLGATGLVAAVGAAGATLGAPGVAAVLPVWMAASLPHTVAGWAAQAGERFGRVLALRLALGAAFVAAVVAMGDGLTLGRLAWAHAAVHGGASALALALGWARPSALARTTRDAVARLLRFGGFSAATTVGATLLRSADAVLLGAVLGPAAVALYGVPQKLIEAAEVPVRGLAGAAFPALARSAAAGDRAALAARLRRDVAALTALLVPAVVVGWAVAPEATALLGGTGYAEAAAPFRWFLLYALLLPADRFLGLALDALGEPRLNTLKVGAMLAANLAGDALALALGFGVAGVAAVTVGMTTVGVAVGAGLVARRVPLVPTPVRSIPQALSSR